MSNSILRLHSSIQLRAISMSILIFGSYLVSWSNLPNVFTSLSVAASYGGSADVGSNSPVHSDADNDGVDDAIDNCVSTANRGADTDGDGLGDACDDSSCSARIPGLISWWRGEGNALDATGTNDGTLQGNVTYAAGKVGQAFKFQNFFQEKVFIDSRVYQMSGGTTSLWFNWDGNQFVHGSNVMIGSSLGGVRRSPLFGVDAGFLLWEFGSLTRTGTNTQVIPGQWYHAVMTYDSNYNIKVYVNGVLVSGGTSVDPVEFRNNMAFGNWNDVNTTAGFGGLVDEVQIYDRPLSDCEVSNLYRSANGLPCEVCDSVAPPTSAATSPKANDAGWNNSDVNVSLSAVDNAGGSGVDQISYHASGAQTIAPTTVNAANANVWISAEGETTITYFAVDLAGNIEIERTLIVKIDKTAPSSECGTPDDAWHSNDVVIPCTVNDNVSGLVYLADSNLTLTTSVAVGTETSNASTNSTTICDLAGNCSTVGPISGSKVDKKAPTVTITAPTADGVYLLNQPLAANYSCTDNGSGVGSCHGPVANGSSPDTASVGAKSFTVTATDGVGNVASPSVVNYTVVFGIEVLYDQTRTHKSGSTVPIKLRLVDANGMNVSSSATNVHALSVVHTGTEASPVIEDAGNANPDLNFRYDSGLGGYVFNLKTTGFVTGSYVLNFTIADGPKVYVVGFHIRQ